MTGCENVTVNTDIEVQGSEPSTALATAITKEITPDHIYALSREIQAPDVTPPAASPPALTTPPRMTNTTSTAEFSHGD